VRTGIDMVFLPRFTQVCSRYGERFLTRIYTDAERQICAGRSASLAARWAGKEAVAKLLGIGLQGLGSGAQALPWQSIEILHDQLHKPCVLLHATALTRWHLLHLESIDISLTHDHEYVMAQAVAIGWSQG
jgi:holo-[acyl-carrier protein] synthase